MVILEIIAFSLLIASLLITSGKKSPNKRLDLIALYILQAFFFINTLFNNLRSALFIGIMLLTYRGGWIFRSFIPYYVFILWGLFTLSYSGSIHYGIMMIVKFLLPLFFAMYAYQAIKSPEDYVEMLKRVCRYLPLLAILSTYPITLLGDITFNLFMGWGKSCDIFAILICVPLTLYAITQERKYLWYTFLMLLPSFTLIRRAAIAGSLLCIGTFFFFRKGIKAIIPITAIGIVTLALILSIAPLRTRFFGGDKGDISGLSNKELLSSTDHIQTSGRDAMWTYALEQFYSGHEIIGCGLGTMKVFLRNDSEASEHFSLLHNDHLHILIETGAIGLSLWILSYLKILSYAYRAARRNSNPYLLRASAVCTMAAIFSIAFNMYYANMLSSLASLPCTFILIGCFLKLRTLYAHPQPSIIHP